jgi:DNA mismatch endonuclease (patch repair protein)
MPVPPASTPAVSKRMKRTRQRDTPKELDLRRELHHRGLRYLVDAAPLPGLRRRADLVFRGPRVAVFVDGCFWHQCPEHGTMPQSNREWWSNKLTRNVARDRDTDERLRAAGWQIVRIWEHDSTLCAADLVQSFVRAHCSATK